MNTQELITQAVTGSLVLILTALTTFVCAWINAKTKVINTAVGNENVHKYIDILGTTVEDVVRAVQHEIVEGMKKASEDGKLSDEEIMLIKAAVADNVVTIVGKRGIKVLESVVGDLNRWIDAKVKAEVYLMKMFEEGMESDG